MKKTGIRIAFFLTALISICIGFSLGEAGDRYFGGGYIYSFLEDGTAQIVKYSGKAEELDIPDELGGKKVTRIGDEAFSGCSFMERISIPESVTSIGNLSFSSCSSLTEIHIPDGVYSIGDQAFSDCSSLASIIIPDSVNSIGDRAFHGCRSLTDITIPDGVKGIGSSMFQGCESLTGIVIPEGVTGIGDLAFFGCNSLQSIMIPDSVNNIGANPFILCENLRDIIVSPDHPYLAYSDGALFSKPDQRLVCYPCSRIDDSYIVPDDTQIIGDYAFYNCQLKNVTIPGNVSDIGLWAFRLSPRLESVSIGNGVTRIGEAAFGMCDSMVNITIPDSVASIGEGALSFFLYRPDGPERTAVIAVAQNSYAAQYCEERGIPYVEELMNDVTESSTDGE